MSRVKPDGEEISWRLTRSQQNRSGAFRHRLGHYTKPSDCYPWGCSLVAVEGSDRDSAGIRALHQELGLSATISDGPTAIRIVLETPNGTVSLS